MKHILRYSLVALFALMSSFSFADTVITFTAGTDKGTETNAGNKGDAVSKDGITIETTSGNSAFAAAQYRFSKGSTTTFTSTVGNITKIVFTCTASGDAKYGPGCFTAPSTGSYTFDDKVGTWTGDAASFTLTASSNQVRATKIEVTVGGEAPAYAAPTISGETSFTESTTVTLTAGEGATIYYTTNGQDPDDREGIEYKASFTLTESATVKAIAYYGSNASAVTSKDFTKLAKIETEGEGTEASPYTVSDIVKLNAGNQLPKSAYVKGTVSKVSETINERYGQLTYWLSTPNTTDTLEVYSGYYLNGDKFTSADQLKVGDVVVVNGNLSVYNGTLEFSYRSTIVSINGVTTGINSAKISADDENAPAFNLAGQRVSRNYKGVVIKNGKKLLQK